MAAAGVILFVIPFIWLGLIISMHLTGKAGEQGIFLGMLSPRDKHQQEAVEKGLRQQRIQGNASATLLRWWPIPLVSLIAGIVALALK